MSGRITPVRECAELVGHQAEPRARDGYVGMQRPETFHDLAHDPAITTVASALVEDQNLLVHPQKIVSRSGMERSVVPDWDELARGWSSREWVAAPVDLTIVSRPRARA